jgi:hypothetical protein
MGIPRPPGLNAPIAIAARIAARPGGGGHGGGVMPAGRAGPPGEGCCSGWLYGDAGPALFIGGGVEGGSFPSDIFLPSDTTHDAPPHTLPDSWMTIEGLRPPRATHSDCAQTGYG